MSLILTTTNCKKIKEDIEALEMEVANLHYQNSQLIQQIEEQNENLSNLIELNVQAIIDNTRSIYDNGLLISANNDSIVSNTQQIVDNFSLLTEALEDATDDLRQEIVEAQEEVLIMLVSEVALLRQTDVRLAGADAQISAELDKIESDLNNAISNLGVSIASTNNYISSAVSSLNATIAAIPDVCDIEGEIVDPYHLPNYLIDVRLAFTIQSQPTEVRWAAFYGTVTPTYDQNNEIVADGRWRLLNDARTEFDGGFYANPKNLKPKPGNINVLLVFPSASGGDGDNSGIINPNSLASDETSQTRELASTFAPDGELLEEELKFEFNPVSGAYRGCVEGVEDLTWFVNGIQVSTNETLIQDIGDKPGEYIVGVRGTLNGATVWAQHVVEITSTGKARTRRGRVKVRRPV